MSDSEESNPFDVEAHQSLLLPTHEPESTPRQILKRAILLVRAANHFMLSGENYSTYSSSSDSSVSIILSPAYTSVGTADGEDNAGSQIVEAAHVSLKLHEDSLIVESTPQNEVTSTIELQRVLRIQKDKITEMVKRENLDELHNYGGVQGVAHALNTDLTYGLSDDHEAISEGNANRCSPVLTFFHLFKEGCNNYTIFLLSLAAILSLSFGITEEGVANGWFDGTILIIAIFALFVFIAIRSYSQARWYQKKFQKQWFSEGRNREVKVIRPGGPLVVPSSDLRVGDLVWLQKGYQVPADGIFVDGQVQLDDGLSLTIDNENPFLFYGSKVINGDARMIVTSVGMDTVWGEMIVKEIESPEKKCEFEVLLHNLRTCVDFIGLLLSILILIVMFLRYSLGKRDDESGYRPDPKGEPTRLKTIIDIIKEIIIKSKWTSRVLIASLSVSVVGIMEGIPFVISFAVAHRSRKTLAENASEKDPLACVKVASVTVICTDKFGGLTEHQKEVDKFFVDKEFVGDSSMVSPNVRESLCHGIGISLLSSSPRGNDSKDLVLISWAEEKFGLRRDTLRHQCSIVKHKEGNLSQYSGVLLLETTENGQEWHLHYKGLPRDILSMCSRYYNVEGEIHTLDGEKRRMFQQASSPMLDGQEAIAYACKRTDESNDMSTEANDLIFVGIVGLRNINQDKIRSAVSTLREGGVRIILVSGESTDVLTTTANNCGLFTPGLEALTGEEFRNSTEEERKQKLDRICIMGNCTLHDKVLLVKCLRKKGEVVAMLGQKKNDAPALKEADIGLTLGTWSSEMAKYCSDIIILNGNFTFLVNLIENGRCIYMNIRKFIQFQLIITISSSLINFIATIVWGDAPMTAFELFWLNLVVAMLGGLALLTEWPKENLIKMSLKSSGQLITKDMWTNIAFQASYQTIICLTLRLKGHAILRIGAGPIKSMIYNSLFLCQLFNIFIARELEKKNIFKGIHLNRWFWVACVLFLMSQAAIVAAENVFDISTRLNWMLWALCILIGLVSWPLDFAGKWIGSRGFLS